MPGRWLALAGMTAADVEQARRARRRLAHGNGDERGQTTSPTMWRSRICAASAAQASFTGQVLAFRAAPKVDTQAGLRGREAGAAAGAGRHGRAGRRTSSGKIGVAGSIDGNADDMRLDLGAAGFRRQREVAPWPARCWKARPQPAPTNSLRSRHHRQSSGIPSSSSRRWCPAISRQATKLGPLAVSAKAPAAPTSADASPIFRCRPARTASPATAGRPGREQRSPFYRAALRGGTVDVTPFCRRPAKGGGSDGGERWSRETLDLSTLQSWMPTSISRRPFHRRHHSHRQSASASSRCATARSPSSELNGNTYGGAIDLTGTLASRGVPTFNGHVIGDNVDVERAAWAAVLANASRSGVLRHRPGLQRLQHGRTGGWRCRATARSTAPSPCSHRSSRRSARRCWESLASRYEDQLQSFTDRASTPSIRPSPARRTR